MKRCRTYKVEFNEGNQLTPPPKPAGKLSSNQENSYFQADLIMRPQQPMALSLKHSDKSRLTIWTSLLVLRRLVIY